MLPVFTTIISSGEQCVEVFFVRLDRSNLGCRLHSVSGRDGMMLTQDFRFLAPVRVDHVTRILGFRVENCRVFPRKVSREFSCDGGSGLYGYSWWFFGCCALFLISFGWGGKKPKIIFSLSRDAARFWKVLTVIDGFLQLPTRQRVKQLEIFVDFLIMNCFVID